MEDYDPKIPTFKQALGSDVSEIIHSTVEIEKYARALDEASDRIMFFTDGKSYRGRPLFYLCISDPANLARLDQITETTRKVREGGGAFPSDHPLTVAIYAAVHGDEISSVEAVLSLAYYLAASRSAETATLLKQLVVIIDPIQNPDGRERFLSYHDWTELSKPVADQNAAEHSEAWPGGRGNGNFFDMNRDWFTLTQPETRTRIRRYFERLPLVLADLHEMGGDSTYYFPPPSAPVNKNLASETIKQFETFGRAIADAFDKNGFSYFHGEVFDECFPGYGSSWPLFNGTLGMTYEQAGVGGLIYRKSSGETMTFADAITHHFTSSLTTIRTAALKRAEILDTYSRLCKQAITPGTGDDARNYVFPPQPRLDQLMLLLTEQGIHIKQLTAPFSSRTARCLVGSPEKKVMNFPAGSMVIPLTQPARRLLKVIMDGHPEMDQHFVDAELERKKHRLESEIYDITGWSLPICYNLSTFFVSEDLPALADWAGPAAGGIQGTSDGNVYAYLVDYSQDKAVAVVAGLLRAGYKVEIAEKSITVGGAEYARGSYILRPAANRAGLKVELESLLKKYGVKAAITQTGFTDGSIDLGSLRVRNLRAPRIGVVMDEPVSSTSYGALKWLLESQYELEFTPLKAADLPFLDLHPYRTLVIPNIRAELLERRWGKEGLERVKGWVESGGTLIAVKGAAEMLLGEDFKLGGGRVLTSFKKDSVEPAPEKKRKGKEEEEEKPPEGEFESPGEIPGTLYRVSLDTLDWMTAGYSDSVPVFISGNLVIDWPEQTDRCLGRFPKSPKISGFSWDIDDKRLENKAYLARVNLGEGQVILFVDEPYFRGYMRGLDRLFMNAVFNGASYLGGLDY